MKVFKQKGKEFYMKISFREIPNEKIEYNKLKDYTKKHFLKMKDYHFGY